MKDTEVPAQITPEGTAAIVTEGTTEAVTTIVILFDVAVVGTAQGELEVRTTVMTSPLFNVADV